MEKWFQIQIVSLPHLIFDDTCFNEIQIALKAWKTLFMEPGFNVLPVGPAPSPTEPVW